MKIKKMNMKIKIKTFMIKKKKIKLWRIIRELLQLKRRKIKGILGMKINSKNRINIWEKHKVTRGLK